jgi:hypothetical protein
MEEFHYIDVSFYASIKLKHIGAKIIVKVEAGENDSLRSLVENAIREKLQNDATCAVAVGNEAVEAAK